MDRQSFEKRIGELCVEGNSILQEPSDPKQAKKIKRVPQILRDSLPAGEKCFDPKLLFLGPLHRDPKMIIHKEAEELKSKAIKVFIAKASHEHCSQVFRWICKNIIEFKRMYGAEEEGEEEDNEYAWMLFQDGCAASYFICVFRDYDELAHLFKTHEYISAWMDVILLENQLPYQILERLTSCYRTSAGTPGILSSFVDVIIDRFYSPKVNSPDDEEEAAKNDSGAATSFNTNPPPRTPSPSTTAPATGTQISIEIVKENNNNSEEAVAASTSSSTPINGQTTTTGIPLKEEQHQVLLSPGEYVHLLHHLRARLVGEGTDNNNNKLTTTAAAEGEGDSFPCTWRSAAQLRLRGIHFKRSRSSRLLDMSFSKDWIRGYLHVPPISISDSTKTLLLNLVADEMSSDVPNDYAVASYLRFLDSLIDCSDDVKILREANIIDNVPVNDEQVATMFNEIGKDLLPGSALYRDVHQMIQSHVNSKSKTWMAQLCHVYFRNPWTAFAFLGAILITYLTLLQTYLTMFPISDEQRATETKGLLYGLKHMYMLLGLPLPLVVIFLLLVPLFWFIKLVGFLCRRINKVNIRTCARKRN